MDLSQLLPQRNNRVHCSLLSLLIIYIVQCILYTVYLYNIHYSLYKNLNQVVQQFRQFMHPNIQLKGGGGGGSGLSLWKKYFELGVAGEGQD